MERISKIKGKTIEIWEYIYREKPKRIMEKEREKQRSENHKERGERRRHRYMDRETRDRKMRNVISI